MFGDIRSYCGSKPRRLKYVQYMGVLDVKLQCNVEAVISELIIIIIIMVQ